MDESIVFIRFDFNIWGNLEDGNFCLFWKLWIVNKKEGYIICLVESIVIWYLYKDWLCIVERKYFE